MLTYEYITCKQYQNEKNSDMTGELIFCNIKYCCELSDILYLRK